MKRRIFNLIIIDESGSMNSIKKQAIDSVNETIQTIRHAQQTYDSQEHFVTLVSFNDDVKTIYDCVPISEVVEINDLNYHPSRCTALYDAMGISLTQLRKHVANEDSVLVTVVTDGYENASKEYSGAAIKALVDELKDRNWVFAYIGANQDVESVAATISITNVMQFESTCEGTQHMSSVVSYARKRLFERLDSDDTCPSEANVNFFEDLI